MYYVNYILGPYSVTIVANGCVWTIASVATNTSKDSTILMISAAYYLCKTFILRSRQEMECLFEQRNPTLKLPFYSSPFMMPQKSVVLALSFKFCALTPVAFFDFHIHSADRISSGCDRL